MAEPHEYADALADGPSRGRGASLNPGNRYESVRLHILGEFLDDLPACGEELIVHQRSAIGNPIPTVVYRDATRTIINRVSEKSVDIPFEFTVNPYRGCEHGCVYCYARPDHERLGFSSGLDFETRIVAKPDAPALLRKELSSLKWNPQTIAMAGVTDVYQPIERHLRITRGCLEVLAEARNPVGIVTKSRLVTRDLDLLAELHRYNAVGVAISVTTLDKELSMKMEPRAASPADRLRTIRDLRAAGIPVTAMVAPVIPGLNDREIPRILEAVADAGAINAAYVLLRLPHQVKALFLDWLARRFPDRARHVETLIRDTREGQLYNSAAFVRRRGSGAVAEQIKSVFSLFRRRHGLDRPFPALSAAHFRRPDDHPNAQMALFTP